MSDSEFAGDSQAVLGMRSPKWIRKAVRAELQL